MLKRYWEAEPGSICLVFCGIDYDWLGNCGWKPVQCTLCVGSHKLEEHKYRVNRCKVGFGKIYTHVIAVCENCGSNY